MRRVMRTIWAGMRTWACSRLGLTPRQLPMLVMEVVDKCNLRCPMCGACDNTGSSDDYLSLDEWKKVIQSAVRLKTLVVSITGGAPMLRPDLYDIIQYARDCGLYVHLCSNGTLLDEHRAKQLHEAGLNTISFSVDGPRAEIHELIRGRGTFEKTIGAIAHLRRLAPEIKIGITTLIARNTFRYATEMVSFAQSLGVSQLKFTPIHQNLQHRRQPPPRCIDLLFRPEDLAALKEELSLVQAALAQSNLETSPRRFFEGIPGLYHDPPIRHRCVAGYAITVVDCRGNVAACFDKDGGLNVRQRPLHEIWRSPEMKRQRRLVRQCQSACWDTTYAELSLRFSPNLDFATLLQTWRDLHYYVEGNSRRQQRPKPDTSQGT